MRSVIAVDAMGGDHGPAVTVPASLDFLASHPGAELLLVGRPEPLERELARGEAGARARATVVPAAEVIGMDEDVRTAIRTKKNSSMRVAIDLVKDARAHACVSAGNTGALMGTAKFVLKTLPGIDRPAICAVLPTRKGQVYALDLGANADCTPEHLVQFAIMGATLVRAVEGKDPTVGLLNIGAEEMKGNEVVRRAGELLRLAPVRFHGNVEGDDIYKGTTDVVVCDGFAGNVALKTSEGLAKMLADFLREEYTRTPLTRLAALVSAPVIRRFRRRVDHRRYNGAALLGLKGIVVKSHGSADRLAFATALGRADSEVRHGLIERIGEEIARLNAAAATVPRTAA